ncbi:proton-coupled zinc antiporter SLC30A2 [Drosophila tropicalis]|uniref:proton-coupled zinc antiporter SLC30A2 n=1 Tax=Drosophila tropicalis TaxID=46794 RepID=UPI0035AC212D
MSKYQKLDSALAPTSHDDDYDESFSLYFDDNQHHQQQQQQQHHHEQQLQDEQHDNSSNSSYMRLNIVGGNRSTHLPNGNPKYHINNNNNNKNNNGIGNIRTSIDSNIDSNCHESQIVCTNNPYRDLDEHSTWEVPLLDNSEDMDIDHLHSDHELGNTRRTGEADEGRGSGMGNGGCRSSQPGFGANLKSKSSQEAKLKILLAISLCCIFMIIEFLGGYMAGSLAIMTDAAHLASDCISFVIGLVAIWLGGRPPDGRMSFGYKRFEVLGAMASILGVWLLTAMLVVVAIERLFSQDYELDANVMMSISGIGIAINIVMMFVLHGSWFIGGHGHGHSHSHGGHGHGHSHAHANAHTYTVSTGNAAADDDDASGTSATATTMPNGHYVAITNDSKPFQQIGKQQPQSKKLDTKPEQNLNLRAAMIHVIGDLVQSIGVFLAAVLIKFCPSAKFADPLCTLLFSVIVIMTTVQLFRESISILLDAVPRNVCLRTLERELKCIEGVRSVHHLNVWQHTSEFNVLMAHLIIDETCSDSSRILKQATELANSEQFNIKHATIQIEHLTSV